MTIGNEHAATTVRRFHRWYADILARRQASIPRVTAAQARVLVHLRERAWQGAELRRYLGIDPGYFTRILTELEARGWITRIRAPDDTRQRVVSLAREGRAAADVVEAELTDACARLLEPLTEQARAELLRAMLAIRRTLRDPGLTSPTITLRAPLPGEYGWIITQHTIHCAPSSMDSCSEGIVATAVAHFAARHDPHREGVWIAELDGAATASAFCIAQDEHTAEIHGLLVTPDARGQGIGSALVRQCLRFARGRGYRRLTAADTSRSDWHHILTHAGFRPTAPVEARGALHADSIVSWTRPLGDAQI